MHKQKVNPTSSFPNIYHKQFLMYSQKVIYTITLFTLFVQTYSVWYVILSPEKGVVHRIK